MLLLLLLTARLVQLQLLLSGLVIATVANCHKQSPNGSTKMNASEVLGCGKEGKSLIAANVKQSTEKREEREREREREKPSTICQERGWNMANESTSDEKECQSVSEG